ncbi:GH32 C-terminal domain-containing protein [Paenibacillus sp. P26]|nr:GH32 C-terminal domain-containing protein [Paenibacillus sp. P26]UUZ97338.1 GH32 C-terminal domain-containing protein [Paenibacillus sp. P25]
MIPIDELKALRRNHRQVCGMHIVADTEVPLTDMKGDTMEILGVFSAESRASEYGFRLRCSEDGRQFTEIAYSVADGKLKVDRNHSGAGEAGISEARLSPMEDGRIELRLFLDRSSVELFANRGVKTITNRIYPDQGSIGLKLFARGGEAVLISLDVWDLCADRD